MATFVTMPQALIAQLAATTDGSAAAVTAPTVLLVSDAHDFDAAASANYVADIVADEVAPTNYARQSLTFAGPISIDSNGRASIDWIDTGFGLLGGAVNATLGGAYVFDDDGDDATSRLLYQVPFDSAQTTDGTITIVRWSSPAARVAP